jgi:hypothetical protein
MFWSRLKLEVFSIAKFLGLIRVIPLKARRTSQHLRNFLLVANVATLALGLRLRQRGLQGCKPRGSPRITPHAPRSVGKCEGMNPHTPK